MPDAPPKPAHAAADCAECRDVTRFLNGFRAFRKQHYETDPEPMRRLVQQGQAPLALVVACSDSRVDPALLFGTQPGEVFTVRNVANLVPPHRLDGGLNGTSAAIEYAVRDLKVDHVIVMGHARCGGIKALLGAAGGQWPDRDYIGDWVAMALDACRLHVHDPEEGGGSRPVALERLQQNPDLVERAAILGSIGNLLTYPWLKARVDAGELTLHGWWFDMEAGDLWATEPGRLQLLPVE